MVRWNAQRKVETRSRGDERQQVSEQAIAQRAYEKFLARGGNHGDDQRDWFEAERELKAETRSN